MLEKVVLSQVEDFVELAAGEKYYDVHVEVVEAVGCFGFEVG